MVVKVWGFVTCRICGGSRGEGGGGLVMGTWGCRGLWMDVK